MNLLIKSILVAVLINLILPAVVKPFATPDQITPPDGAENLLFFDQLIHMFVHHAQVPLTSSLIIVVIVGLSILIGEKIPL